MQHPNFFIVGAPKAGTTSLYFYLDEHPQIYMSPIKETNFFSYHEIKQQALFYNEEFVDTPEKYAAQFSGVKNEIAVGEASVSYLFYPSVPQKIKTYQPAAKILIVLRNPVDRAFSHYLMDKRLGFVNLSFEDILFKKRQHPQLHLYYQQYIELGFYYEQVKRYIDTFGHEQVKIFLYEDLLNNIHETISSIYSFLNVAPNFKPSTEEQHNTFSYPKNKLIEKLYAAKGVRKTLKKFAGNKAAMIKDIFMAKDKKPKMLNETKVALQLLYQENISKTANLIHRDLNNWMQPVVKIKE